MIHVMEYYIKAKTTRTGKKTYGVQVFAWSAQSTLGSSCANKTTETDKSQSTVTVAVCQCLAVGHYTCWPDCVCVF